MDELKKVREAHDKYVDAIMEIQGKRLRHYERIIVRLINAHDNHDAPCDWSIGEARNIAAQCDAERFI